MTKIINLWAGGGVGKSTNQARLFYMMKSIEKDHGFRVEMVREYVKPFAWMKTPINSAMQNHIFFSQLQLEMTLVGNVDYIITDSPTGISCVYHEYYVKTPAPMLRWENLKRSTVEVFDFWCPRVKPYNQDGRYETAEMAKDVDAFMQKYIEDGAFIGREPLRVLKPDVNFADEIFELVKEKAL